MTHMKPIAAALLALALAACGGGEQEEEIRTEQPAQRDVAPAEVPETWEQAEEEWQARREDSDALWDRVTERAPDLNPEQQRALQSCIVLALRQSGVSEDEAFEECRAEVEEVTTEEESEQEEDESPPEE